MKRTAMMGAAMVLVTGCIKFQGQERNPAFAEAKVPEPTVAVAPVACRSSHPNTEGNEFTSQFRTLVKAQIHGSLVTLDAEQTTVVCATLGKDYGNVISLGGSSEKDWRASGAVTAVVQEIASRTKAKSVFIPLAAFSTNCSRDTARVKDEQGNTVATIDKGTQTCDEGTGAMMRGYLFSPEGQIYWKSWAVVRSTNPDAIDGGVASLLLGMPATFGSAPAEAEEDASPAPKVAASKDAAGPALAAPSGKTPRDIEGALAAMDAGAPSVCKEYVRTMCEKAGAPAAMRGQMCAGYVTAMRPMTASPNAALACKSALRAIKPGG